MVVSCSGKIIYVSDRVEKILGHSQVMHVLLWCYCYSRVQWINQSDWRRKLIVTVNTVIIVVTASDAATAAREMVHLLTWQNWIDRRIWWGWRYPISFTGLIKRWFRRNSVISQLKVIGCHLAVTMSMILSVLLLWFVIISTLGFWINVGWTRHSFSSCQNQVL